MSTYAKETTVPVDKTRNEIERTLMRYGATGFMYGYHNSQAMIAFEMHGRRIRLTLELPDKNADEFVYKRVNQHAQYGKRRTKAEQEGAWEQACRQKWRALLLIIKAKLEAIESGITSLDDEFLSGVMLPDGRTVGEWARPQIKHIYLSGSMPPLLPGGVGDMDVIEGEID